MPTVPSSLKKTDAINPSLGMISAQNPWEISDLALEYAQNFRFFRGPDESIVAQTRPGIEKITLSAWSDGIKDFGWTPSGTMVVATDSAVMTVNGSCVYSAVGSTDLDSNARPTLIPFGKDLVVLDGKRPKFYRGESGVYGVLTDTGGRLRETELQATDSNWLLYTGNLNWAGEKLTTPDWGVSTGVQVTHLRAKVYRLGLPAGHVTARFVDADASAIANGISDPLAASAITGASTGVAQVEEFEFSNGPTVWPSTTYRAGIFYSSATASAALCVGIPIADDSTINWGVANRYTGAAMQSMADEHIIFGLKPGLAPKARFGKTRNERLWLAGDQDHSGFVHSKAHFCDAANAGTWGVFDDLSQAGNIGIDRPDGAAIVGMGQLYNALFFFKGGWSVDGEELPGSVHQLTGVSPADYSVSLLQKNITSPTGYGIAEVVDDLYFPNTVDGWVGLRGVERFGDLEAYPLGLAVLDKFQGETTSIPWLDTVSLAEFNPITNEIYIKLTGYSDVLAFNRITGGFSVVKFNGVTVSAFKRRGQSFYIAGTDGHIYEQKESLYLDDDRLPEYKLYGKAHTVDGAPNTDKQAVRATPFISVNTAGASARIAFWKDLKSSSEAPDYTRMVTMGGGQRKLSEIATVPLSTMATLKLQALPATLRAYDLNWNYKYLQMGLDNLVPFGDHVFIKGITLESFLLGSP